AASRSELAAIILDVHNAAALQYEDALFVLVEVERRLARWNQAHKLGDLPAPQIGVNQIAEFAILTGTDYLAVLFVDGAPCLAAGRGGARFLHDMPAPIFWTAGAHDQQRFRTRILNAARSARRDVDSG